ncbi:SGNH/GDSL hydrolase family protein [Pseudahrensia aquimaris]|uniref:SGNH/GDSL hydrolase family protein n=1 Tax=Pseudahrensia aquimaris TaxID=744461 RepID=A0ABW3FDA5_9HYPH
MNTALASFLSWLALPVYFGQGAWVRMNSMRLPPPVGPLHGVFGKGEPSLRLLVVGDSSAAGVGLETTNDQLGPQMARKLHETTGKTVSWRTSGHNSATAGQVRDYVVPHLEPSDYTHIVLMLGTNDMKNFHSGPRWKKEFGTLIYALCTRFPASTILWHQAIDLSVAPALPHPLATILNWRKQVLNRIGAKLCLERGAVCVPPLPDVTAAGFCLDGFHANAGGYDAWADHMIAHMDVSDTAS